METGFGRAAACCAEASTSRGDGSHLLVSGELFWCFLVQGISQQSEVGKFGFSRKAKFPNPRRLSFHEETSPTLEVAAIGTAAQLQSLYYTLHRPSVSGSRWQRRRRRSQAFRCLRRIAVSIVLCLPGFRFRFRTNPETGNSVPDASKTPSPKPIKT